MGIMAWYNIAVLWDGQHTEEQLCALGDLLADHHGTVSVSPDGHPTVDINLDMDTLRDAQVRGYDLVVNAARDAGLGDIVPIAVEAMTEHEFERRHDLLPPSAPIPA
jgi:hypothetical protein